MINLVLIGWPSAQTILFLSDSQSVRHYQNGVVMVYFRLNLKGNHFHTGLVALISKWN